MPDTPPDFDAGLPQSPAQTPPPKRESGFAATVVGDFGTHGPGPDTNLPTPEAQDLSRDPLLLSLSRVSSAGKDRPVIGGIRLHSKLGQGGMGAVYLGINLRLDTWVAVKILPLVQGAGHEQMVSRFIREARMAARVRSPHIVTVYDINVERGIFYITMEYVNGLTAGMYLREFRERTGRGLAQTVALEICIAVVEGLQAAHAEGIIHRDIKPDNVIVPLLRGSVAASKNHDAVLDFQHAKLLDLGLARSSQAAVGNSLTGDATGLGTPGYMPPEQALDAQSAREPADIYSMGATLYALLAGHAPHRGSTPLNVALATVNDPHLPLASSREDIHPAIIELIEACLRKKCDERPKNAQELLQKLRECRFALDHPADTLRLEKEGGERTPQPSRRDSATSPSPRPSSGQGALRGAGVSIGLQSDPPSRPQSEPYWQGTRRTFLLAAGTLYMGAVALAMIVLIGAVIWAVSGSHKSDEETSSDTTAPDEDTDTPAPARILVRYIVPPSAGTVKQIKVRPEEDVSEGELVFVLAGYISDIEVKSPFSGRVRTIFVKPGDWVTPQTKLVLISVKEER